MKDQERRILLGRILGAFGVRGEVKIDSFTDPARSLLKYQPWVLSHRGVEREIDKASGREVARGKTGVVFVGDAPDGGKKVSPLPEAFLARLRALSKTVNWSATCTPTAVVTT